jgi:acyl-CoA thioesterase
LAKVKPVFDLPVHLAQMWAQDAASQALGIFLLDLGDQSATLGLTVDQRHLNSRGIAHGGVIFALADSAFAYASNSGGESAVSQSNSITYLAPGQLGQSLVAQAALVSRVGRNAIYDVTVKDSDETILALMRVQARFVAA